ncbi:MAG: GGDEF domain-containing protein [Acidimicrobiia bacterium]|nr:GGDEF domain-containing protein [Acidimicrobiia bacterium]
MVKGIESRSLVDEALDPMLAVERRQGQLWTVAYVVMIGLAGVTALVSVGARLSGGLSVLALPAFRLGVILFAVAVAVYLWEKQRQLRRLMRAVIDDRVRLAELAERAERDALTGLPNRAAFSERLEQHLARTARRGGSTAVVFVDLDRFKEINDSLGHDGGDAVLRETAARLRAGVRAEDSLARWGGDEFTVLAEEGSAGALALAERLSTALRAPVKVGGHEVRVSASLGVAVTNGESHDAVTLVRQADVAMYLAKQGGRDRAELFSPILAP